MGAVATITGADTDPIPIPSISVDPVVLVIMVDLVVPAIMVVPVVPVGPVGPVVLAVTADR